jgi:predicted dehydrogenase
MQENFKIGLVGVAHGHVWHILNLLKESNLGKLVAVSIEDNPILQTRKDRMLNEYNIKMIYNDYQEMLDKEDLDILFNYTNHTIRAAVTELAASKGLHIMVEKPMAYSLKDAETMLKAATKNKVKLMVNWPSMWSPVYRKTYDLIKKDMIGSVFHIRTRIGHDMPQKELLGKQYDFQWMGLKEAGGAFLDFCCYGTALTVWLLGMPKQVFGIASNFVKNFLLGPDNGILVMMYDKSTANIEGTWSQIGRISGGPVIFGTKGTLSLEDDKLMMFTKDKPDGESIKLDPLPERERNPVEYFLTCVKENKPIDGMCDPKLSRDVQEVLEAGLISSDNCRVTKIPINRK